MSFFNWNGRIHVARNNQSDDLEKDFPMGKKNWCVEWISCRPWRFSRCWLLPHFSISSSRSWETRTKRTVHWKVLQTLKERGVEMIWNDILGRESWPKMRVTVSPSKRFRFCLEQFSHLEAKKIATQVMYVALIGLQFIERIYIGPNEAKSFIATFRAEKTFRINWHKTPGCRHGKARCMEACFGPAGKSWYTSAIG